MDKDLTIFIPTFKRNALLNKCIISVKNSIKNINISYEIIIVNENYEKINSLNDINIKVLNFDREVLPCYAMYYALLNSEGKYFLRIDDDNEINVDLISLLYNYIINNDRVAYCGALGIGDDNNITNPGTILSKHLKLSLRPMNINNEVHEVDLVDNVCKFFPWSLEDAYDQIRLKKLGYKIVILSSAVTTHHRHRKSLNTTQVYYYARSKLIFYIFSFNFKFTKSILLALIGLLYIAYIYKSDIKNIKDLLLVYFNYIKGIIDGIKFVNDGNVKNLYDNIK